MMTDMMRLLLTDMGPALLVNLAHEVRCHGISRGHLRMGAPHMSSPTCPLLASIPRTEDPAER
jgi:hypothetical protein